MKIFQTLFCKHNYVKIDWMPKIVNGLAYSVRLYKCEKCGKEIRVDGRCDPYE